jgi:hypothetical protein
MGLTAWCPRCREPLGEERAAAGCPGHGSGPTLWRPEQPTYDAFVLHLRAAGDFPTYLPWPMGPGWAVSDFAVTTSDAGRPVGTLTCVSGTSELDGPVDVFVVAEEPATGLGARCAGLPGDDPGREVGDGVPPVRIRIGSVSVPLWAVSTSVRGLAELDRTVLAGEASGRWLWIVLRPASAVLLMRDEWILRDVSGLGPPLVEMPFGGTGPVW